MIPNIFSLLGESIVGKHIAKGIIFSNSPKNFHPNGSRIQEYEKLGVKTSDEKNNEWTYKGKGVAVIYDKDHWIYTNDTIPEKKAVYLEVVRDKKDRVTELREITKKEMQKLFDEE